MLAWFNKYWLFVYLQLDSSLRKSDTGILGSFGSFGRCALTLKTQIKNQCTDVLELHVKIVVCFVMWNVFWSFLSSGLRKQEYLFLIMFSSWMFFLFRLSGWVLQAVRLTNSNLNDWYTWCRYVDFVYDLLEMFAWYILAFFAYLQLYFHCWLFYNMSVYLWCEWIKLEFLFFNATQILAHLWSLTT